ncbi:NADPH-dependent FMN reductase [Streptomyces luteogriseus]|uniref:NADPH-dependent FMN reductase n=1 Tax=Streptomyces luteogriseus TaxID=68233 RepID=UPI0037B07BFD
MAENQRLRSAVIVGSIRKGRFGHVAAEWPASRARSRPDFDGDVIDPVTAWPSDVASADPSAPRPQAVKDLAPWPEAAGAFVVVTPEHHRTFPASPKNAIDGYDPEWHAIPVARRRRGRRASAAVTPCRGAGLSRRSPPGGRRLDGAAEAAPRGVRSASAAGAGGDACHD